MKDTIRTIIEKAEEFLSDGKYLLEDEREEASANRAYYAAFTATRALLHSLEIEVKSHKGVQVKFSQHFIKAGIFEPKYNQIITTLFDVKQRVDYDYYSVLELEQAQLLMEYAEDFVLKVRKYLESTL
ncbi:MAG: HEPN domain-containing protein [Bacteroidota bacterium]